MSAAAETLIFDSSKEGIDPENNVNYDIMFVRGQAGIMSDNVPYVVGSIFEFIEFAKTCERRMRIPLIRWAAIGKMQFASFGSYRNATYKALTTSRAEHSVTQLTQKGKQSYEMVAPQQRGYGQY